MKKNSGLMLLIIFVVLVISYTYVKDVGWENDFEIVRYPTEQTIHLKLVNDIDQVTNPEDDYDVNLRESDLSGLDLRNELNLLEKATFDSHTIWPTTLPKEFNPNKIIEIGKNPGLNVRDLHKQGITGKGVSVGIIDFPLLINHVEYDGRIKFYDEVNINFSSAHFHGTAVTSILGGKTVGVAPEVNFYYIGCYPLNGSRENPVVDFKYVAEALDRLVEVNKTLAASDKIRVISLQIGWDLDSLGADSLNESVRRATDDGIFVISTSMDFYNKYPFNGLNREVYSNPDDLSSYLPGLFYNKEFFRNMDFFKGSVYFPMDSRAVATATGNMDYLFTREGGFSWVVPYIAGLYALSCQVNPEVTPDLFWEKAYETGDILELKMDTEMYTIDRMVNPVKLIESLNGK